MCVCSYHGLWNVLHVYSCICIPCDINHAHDTTEHNTMRGPRHKREMPNCLQGWVACCWGKTSGCHLQRKRERERKGKNSVSGKEETTTDGGHPHNSLPFSFTFPLGHSPFSPAFPFTIYTDNCRIGRNVALHFSMNALIIPPTFGLRPSPQLFPTSAVRRCNRICLTSMRRKCENRWDECIRN